MRSKRPVAPPRITPQEFDILARYGEAFQKLLSGERPPNTPDQQHFIDACQGRVKPTSKYEKAYIKHLQREQFDRGEERRRQELRDRKAAAEKKAKLAALKMRQEQKQRRRQKLRDQKAAAERSAKLWALEMENERKRNLLPSDLPPASSDPPVVRKKRKRRNPEFSPPPEIPEYEEGYPRPGWFTDEDWKKLRSRYP